MVRNFFPGDPRGVCYRPSRYCGWTRGLGRDRRPWEHRSPLPPRRSRRSGRQGRVGLDPPARDGRYGTPGAVGVRTEVHGRTELPDADGHLRYGHCPGTALTEFSVRQLQKYAALPSADRWLLLSATFWLVFCRIALWILPFQDILRRIESMDGGAPTTANPAAAARIAWAVDAASRYVPGTGMCLPRALAAAVLLTRAGLPARLWVGAARGDGGRPQPAP